MRIIAGSLRGRRLRALPGRLIRPTGDRMKESMFSALGDFCRSARVLDLFAGSGALGFEALSRGAIQATFVEKSRTALKVIAGNARTLGVEGEAIIIKADVFSFLRDLKKEAPFDLVFADPPFKNDLAQKVHSWWLEHHRKGSVLVLEYPCAFPPLEENDAFKPVKTANFGESSYSIYLAP
ncbi:MAG TPA: 16S rRNA (guanine(966)-N(2))-methyltransferase RsmD [archaeon]|nr:16S rRNA (guanine(966)-N(2))-methyltransferase RsmD [archaeon]